MLVIKPKYCRKRKVVKRSTVNSSTTVLVGAKRKIDDLINIPKKGKGIIYE